ncbi:hypothetical protein C7S17_0637 [Burkholderia thailandensis]|nr:hypothetical protein [Burkholderia thailandensis]
MTPGAAGRRAPPAPPDKPAARRLFLRAVFVHGRRGPTDGTRPPRRGT